MTPMWQPGTVYLPGDVVRPVTQAAFADTSITNPGFESGDTAWNKTGAAVIVMEAGSFAGDWHAKLDNASGTTGAVAMATPVAVSPGQSITASCMIRATGPDQTGGDINIIWLDASDAILRSDQGNEVNSSNGTDWKKSVITGVAPAGAAKVYLQADAFALNAGGVVRIDNFAWNYVTAPAANSGLVYRAVQPEAGTSGGSEPAWPGVLGQTVHDNTVTWEAITSAYVTWEANPLFKSGATEPTWPTEVGGMVSDGTIAWEAVSRRVTDENCPNSKVVVIVASKVFAEDEDIVRYSATANPLDWTTPEDAGYLATGLQQANANNMAVLQQYRGNLVAWNPSCFQMWQVDPDPALMSILDQMDGVGSSWQQAAHPVSNDLLYLSQQGVRSVGIANAAENLQAGDVGSPIDSLVQDAMFAATGNDSLVLATYFPGMGQYWLTFSEYPPPPVGITGDLPDGLVGASGTYQYVASGGVLPYAFAVTAGSLPPGASLNTSTGLVTYDYTTEGDYAWTVQVTDATGDTATVDDTASIGNPVSWMVSGDRNTGAEIATTGDYLATTWTDVGSPPSGNYGYVLAHSGRYFVSDSSASQQAVSLDAGVTWTNITTAGVSAGGGRMAGGGGYAYLCRGVATLARYNLATGVWSNAASTLSRANSAVYHNGKVLVASIYANSASVSLDNGSSWASAGANYTASGVNGASLLESDGTRLVVLYNGGASSYVTRIAYSDDDGATWTQAYAFPVTGSSTTPAAIKFHDGNWLAMTLDGQVASSPDGATWTLATAALSGVMQLTGGLGRFVAVKGTAAVYYTDDLGETWPTASGLPGGMSAAHGVAWMGDAA